MLNRHTDLTFLHISAKAQQPVTFTSHVITMYVHEINIPFKSHICTLNYMQIEDNHVSKYALYELTAINNVSRSTGIHISHILVYTTEQIFVPHCIYIYIYIYIYIMCMFHCIATVVNV